MKPLLDIIVITYNNAGLLTGALNSMGLSTYGPSKKLVRYIVVNNGHPDSLPAWLKGNSIIVVQAPENIGWEKGLKLGLGYSDAPFVAFANDDIRFVPAQKDWFWKIMCMFNDPKVAGVGPCSNYIAGPQNLFADIEEKFLDVKYLIGLFFVLRRSALDEVGGVDDTLPGGDDIDLSIRLRDAGYRLVCRRDVYVHHHGSVTGARVHGLYWDSKEHQNSRNLALIRKHGMKKFWETWVMGYMDFTPYTLIDHGTMDAEGDVCKEYVIGDKVLELGCGGVKTVPNAVGVDILPKGAYIPFVAAHQDACKSDLIADVSTFIPVEPSSQDTIIARHILEHCQDTLGTLAAWNKALKMGGRLIVAVPNQALGNTIVMNPEHLNSFVPSSLDTLCRIAGFKNIGTHHDVNRISCVCVYEKEGDPDSRIANPEKTVTPQASRLEMVPA